jgi:transposase-like protein
MARPTFPRSLPEFIARFGDERDCFEYLIASRFPDGFRCDACDHDVSFQRGDRLAIACARCKRVVSATSGTVMHRTRQPLSLWLLAAFLMTTDKRGISAMQLQRQLGLTRYETAYQMLHKLRAAMVAPTRSLLSGTVEVDETVLGSPKRGRPSEEAPEKMIVVGALERHLDPKTGRCRAGRARFRFVPDRTQLALLGFVADSVAPGTVVVTDGLSSYNSVPLIGYERSVESSTQGMKQADVLPVFHRVVSNLKAWLSGTHHGGVSAKHLQAYLNEFVFRFNRRRTPQAAFQTLLGLAPKVSAPTYEQLYTQEGEPGGWEHPTDTAPDA